MSTGEPFFFDQHVFDSDDPHAYEEQKPEKPEFTASELDAAKAQAFEEGKRAGVQENEASLTQSVLGLLQKVDRDMNVLRVAEQDRIQKFEAEALHLTHSIISKIFPVLNKTHGQEELQNMIASTLESQRSIEKLSLEVHGDMLPPLKVFLEQQDAGKNIALSSNSALGLDEFRITWPDGGLIVNRLDMVDEILTMIQETLAERGVTVHDNMDEDIDEKKITAPDNEGEPEE